MNKTCLKQASGLPDSKTRTKYFEVIPNAKYNVGRYDFASRLSVLNVASVVYIDQRTGAVAPISHVIMIFTCLEDWVVFTSEEQA